MEQYTAWYEDVHSISVTFESTTEKQFALRGNDLLRSPGFGGYTFGIAVRNHEDGLMTGQRGTWALTRLGNTVSASFGAITLSGELDATRDCQSLVITGRFDRRSAGFGPESSYQLALYVDGKEQAQAQATGVLESVKLEEPTLLSAGALGPSPRPPVLLNTMLTQTSPVTVEAFAERLCDARPGTN